LYLVGIASAGVDTAWEAMLCCFTDFIAHVEDMLLTCRDGVFKIGIVEMEVEGFVAVSASDER
jgi:hypothetical protein